MIKRTFIDRSNTIFEGSHENYGLHPICMLNYGLEKSRVLIHFDINEIKKFIESCPEGSVIKHTLKMTNCGSIDFKNFSKKLPSKDINSIKKRASSFYIYAFPIPNNADSYKDNGYIDWDEGVGFDSKDDFFLSGEPSVSNEGSNWFNRKSGLKWPKMGCIGDVKKENIIASQRFDHGNENMELDLTDYINGILGEEVNEWSSYNDGICLSIEPQLDGESISDYDYKIEDTKYVGFFNNKTNTFFAPVIESKCDETIRDDRYDFIVGKTNRLYLYVSTPNGFTDLDILPTCEINKSFYNVKRHSKGIYYVEIDAMLSKTFAAERIYEDIWSNIVIEGVSFGDIIQEFVPHPSKSYFSITPDAPREKKYNPSLVGINDDEVLNDGEIRKVIVKYRVPYSTSFKVLNNTEYRLYSKDSNREIDVIDWDGIHSTGFINFFMINTSELVSGDYFVDIRVKTNYEQRVFKNVLHFSKANNVTNITH
jgi:hypothetical protein